MSDRDLSPFFAPKSAAVGAGERATSSGGRLWRTRGARQSQGRHDIRLRIGDLDCCHRPRLRGCDGPSASAQDVIMMIHVVPLKVDAAPVKWPRPPACSRAILVCARAPAVTTCPTWFPRSPRLLNAAAYGLTADFHGCCIFATFCWTCGLSVATLGLSRAKAWGSDRGIGEFAVGLREIVLRFNGSGEG
jgi:hypothetical protein